MQPQVTLPQLNARGDVMIVKVLILLIVLCLIPSVPSPSTKARNLVPSEVSAFPIGGEMHSGPAERFAYDMLRNEFDQAKINLEEFVHFPELREHSRIRGVQLVPSPEKNVKILLAHFHDEVLKGDRLAFFGN